ncbi:MAG: hypothetical protein ACKOYJ_03195 [Planctomycetia bacterium]
MTLEHGCVIGHRVQTLIVAATCVAMSTTGCKSGMSVSKPSWWTFGGGQTAGAEKLATAPPFDQAAPTKGGVAKPSGLASPYPTTTTPESYSMDGAAQTQVAAAAPAQYPATTDAGPITYGRVQQAAAETAASRAVSTYPSPSGSQGSAAPQVGPYAAIPAATQAASTPSQAAQSEPLMPASRIASSRAGDSYAPAASAAGGESVFSSDGSVPVTDAASSRYGDAAPSRFAGPGLASSPSPATVAPQPTPPMIPDHAPPAFTAPTTEPPSTLPGSVPRRRPDPGYRPGGTSSYRPSRSILVGEPTVDPAVRTAGFEGLAEPIRQ